MFSSRLYLFVGEVRRTTKQPREIIGLSFVGTRKTIPVRTTYQRLIQPPPPTRRLTQPPPPPPLIQPPPRTGPLRLIQPALAFGKEASQAPDPTAARIAAPDHFPMLRRNNRRSSNSVSVIAAFSLD